MAQTAFLFLLSARKSKEVRINKKHLEKWPSAENRYYYVCVSHITITTPPTTMTSTKEYAHGKFFDGLLLLMNDRTTCSYMDISPHHITSNQKIYIHTPMKLIPNSYRPNLYTFCWGRQVGINNRNHQSQQSRGLRTALRPPFLDRYRSKAVRQSRQASDDGYTTIFAKDYDEFGFRPQTGTLV